MSTWWKHEAGVVGNGWTSGKVGIVHRLDFDTSGAMVLAKTPAVKDELQKQFHDRKVSKTYTALVFGKPDKNVQGDPKLAKMSNIVYGQISVYGKDAVRTSMIKSIESDLKRKAKKGQPEVEKMIQNALDTPDYMKLIRSIGLDEPHLRLMGLQALKNAGQPVEIKR